MEPQNAGEAAQRQDLPQASLDLIAERNRFDVALYKHATKLFEEAVKKQEAEVGRIAGDLKAARARTQGSLEATLFSLRASARKAINRAYSAI